MTATWSSHPSWPCGLQSLIHYLPHALCQLNIYGWEYSSNARLVVASLKHN
jgi:hypothetical protein